MRILVFIMLVLSSTASLAQNLLANGGFEDENICAEYRVNCSPEGWINSTDVPFDSYFKDPKFAFEGKHCVAIEAGNKPGLVDRTFIRSQLLCKLRKGSMYKIEFYIKSRYVALDSVGILFTYYDFLFENQSPQFLTPSLYVGNSVKHPDLKDTTWQKVSLTYKANGTEIYLAIGNFSQRPVVSKTDKPAEHCFVYLDNISVIPTFPSELICYDWKIRKDAVYNFNIRHQYLQRYIEKNSEDIPEPPALSKTSMQFLHRLVLPEIFFESGKSSLTFLGKQLLDSLCNSLAGRRIDSLITEGHTDSIGSDISNQKLSENRALTVANYVRKKLYFSQQLQVTRGWASEKPVADNRTYAGRQRNRRVEIFLYVR
jgi:outer membrane protein OmpA-like peptidoglycan-associated protein